MKSPKSRRQARNDVYHVHLSANSTSNGNMNNLKTLQEPNKSALILTFTAEEHHYWLHNLCVALSYVYRSMKFDAVFNFFARLFILFYHSLMYETFRTETKIK